MFKVSAIDEVRRLEQQLADAQARLDTLRNDPEFLREQEFEGKLRALMGQYDISLPEVVAMLEPVAAKPARQPKRITRVQVNPEYRKAEAAKVFVNPYTEERIEAKRLSHRTLQTWIKEHGEATVWSWQQA